MRDNTHPLVVSSARKLVAPRTLSHEHLLLLRADSLVKMKAPANKPVCVFAVTVADLLADASRRCASRLPGRVSLGEGVPGETSGWGRGCKRRGPIALKKGGVFSLSFLGSAR